MRTKGGLIYSKCLWLFGGELCKRVREEARMWLGVCGSHPGGEDGVLCLPASGGWRLWVGEGVLSVSSKCFSNARPQWLVSFKRNNIASYKFLVNV